MSGEFVLYRVLRASIGSIQAAEPDSPSDAIAWQDRPCGTTSPEKWTSMELQAITMYTSLAGTTRVKSKDQASM